MTTLNSKELVATSDNQSVFSSEQEALLKVLIRKIAGSAPCKVIQRTEHQVDEVIFESDIDGVHYYLVRCRPKSHEKINLSPREQTIAKLVAQGLPNKTIALLLDISPWTVATHLRRIFVKLDVSSRTAMIARILEESLLEE